MSISPTLTLLKTFSLGLGQKAGVALSFILSKWKFSFTFIFIGFILLSAIASSIDQKSLDPLIDDVGMRLLRLDNDVYNRMVAFEENGRVVPVDIEGKHVFSRVLTVGHYYFDVLSSLWFIGVFVYFLYWVLGKSMFSFNTSASAQHFLLALAIFLLFQSLMGFIVFVTEFDTLEGQTTSDKLNYIGKQVNPVKGVFKFLVNIPHLITFTVGTEISSMETIGG